MRLVRIHGPFPFIITAEEPGSYLYLIFKENKMARKLWFVTDGVSLVDVFIRKNDAEREYLKFQDDPDFAYYEYYGLDVDELEDYPQEYDLALEEGYI